MKKCSVGVAIVSYQGEKHIARCLRPLLQSALCSRVLVVDSSSTDQTVKIARQMGAEVKIIQKETFNHGLTREMARQHLDTDIIVYLTQDAYLVGDIHELISPIVNGQASIAYSRQIPHAGAGFFEAFAREFNYPKISQIRTMADSKKYGIYTCFCSNSCAAYSNQALDEIGGFSSVLLGEDTLAAAKLLLKGHAIAYVAESEVYHSHRYGLIEEFRRYFATGTYRKQHRDLLSQFGNDESRGKEFIRQMMKRLIQEKPHLIPYACVQTVMKWLGYNFGSRFIFRNHVKH